MITSVFSALRPFRSPTPSALSCLRRRLCSMSADPESELLVPESSEPEEKTGSTALRVITWFSVGIAVAAVGIYVGAELRNRYRFKKRSEEHTSELQSLR